MLHDRMLREAERQDAEAFEYAETVPFRLPDGRIVQIRAEVAGFHNFLTFQVHGGRIVWAERVVSL